MIQLRFYKHPAPPEHLDPRESAAMISHQKPVRRGSFAAASRLYAMSGNPLRASPTGF